jgi:hypothetical protein
VTIDEKKVGIVILTEDFEAWGLQQEAKPLSFSSFSTFYEIDSLWDQVGNKIEGLGGFGRSCIW